MTFGMILDYGDVADGKALKVALCLCEKQSADRGTLVGGADVMR